MQLLLPMPGSKRISLLILLLLTFNVLMAQQGATQLKGRVLDNNGQPLSKVTIFVKGQKATAITNDDGAFTLSVSDPKAVLVFSYVGFQSKEVSADGQTDLEVRLVPIAANLNEVVVVGYGTQKKREITSAVTRVDAAQFNKGNISDVSQLLQGKVAGLSVSRPGGDPSGAFTIRLRGLSTLGANTTPLVVVDGQVGVDINTIDPNDIASVDVLKDGASAAIYGTRGSAGVIIITTKSGTRGLPQVNYNGSVTAEKGTRFTKHMSAAEFRKLLATTGKGTDYGASTDWDKEITRTGITHSHNISLSGGSPHTSYNVSINYRNGQGIAITTGYQQVNGRLNLVHKALNDKLVFTVDLSSTRRTAQLGYSNAFEYATIYNPTSPVHTPIGSPEDLAGGGWFEVQATDYSNPVALLMQNTNNVEVKRYNLAGTAEYEIVKGLKFLLRYAQQTIRSDSSKYSPINAYANRGFDPNSDNGYGRHGYEIQASLQNYNQLYENTLSYQKKIGELDLGAVGGYSYQQFTNTGNHIEAGNFVTDAAAGNIGAALDITSGLAKISSSQNANKLVAFFGRLNLNYKNTAFLMASLRREGSTQFGPNNRWGNFPAVSGGLDITRLVEIPSVNNLKIRASYGVTGSLPPFSYLSLPTLAISGSYYAGNNLYGYTYAPNQNANPNLKWERKAETDIGTDFSLFNGRLSGTMDYFKRTTSNLIFNATVPVPPNLVSTTWENIGTMTSNGFEVALNYDIVRARDFTWNSAINYSFAHVRLKSLDPSLAGSYVGASNLGSPGQEATQITRAMQGQPIGLFYNAVYKGVNQNGKYLFSDGKGGTVVDDNTYQTVIGHALPKFEMGWSNTFKYKNWDFNFFLRGSFGHQLINTYRAFYENPTVSSVYNVVNTKYYNPNVNDAQLFSSLFVEKASFVKLDNATLGYNLPIGKAAMGSGIRSLRFFLTGYNLFMITNYTGADPEVRYQDQSTFPPNILAPGIDRRETWVLTRSFTFGANLGF
ncbi:MAG TPA: SusC/RagA family TonB-linked outer membrane protein [Puia sp.]|nr:SusC/RagA family TonB-linked outer membrane protein [Puia sp.]